MKIMMQVGCSVVYMCCVHLRANMVVTFAIGAALRSCKHLSRKVPACAHRYMPPNKLFS